MGIFTRKSKTPEDELLKTLVRMSDEAINATEKRREKWKKLYNYWVNKQLPESRPSYKSDIRVNFCWVTTQVKIPVMTENNPTVNFLSFDKSTQAEAGAQKMSSLVGNALWNKLGVQTILQSVIQNSIIYDAGFWKVGFDPSVDNGVGEVFISSIEPFKILPDPFALEINDCRYVIHIEPYPVSTLQKKYPQFANLIKADETISDILYESRRYAERTPSLNVFDENTEFSLKRAILKEYWLSPSESDLTITETVNDGTDETGIPIRKNIPKYRNGRVITTINDEIIVDDKPNPYAHGKFPFVKQVSNIVGNEFWGIGDLEQIIPLQDGLNHAYQQIDDIANATANIGWTLDPTGIDTGIINKLKKALGRPGVLKLVKPEALRPDTPPQIPGYLIRRVDELKNNLQLVSGITDIMQGSGRVTHRTARGIERLYEAGTQRIGTSVRNMENALKHVALLTASVAQQYYTEARTYALIGTTGAVNGTIDVSPGELIGEYEVSIDSGASLPQDRQSRIDLAFNLLKNNIFAMAMGVMPGMAPEAQKEMAKIILNSVQYPGREAILAWKQPAPVMPPQAPGASPAGENPLLALMGGGAPAAPQASTSSVPPEVEALAKQAGVPVEQLLQMLSQTK